MKIMAVCGSGLGSSFLVEMNIKKVLNKLNREADVSHADLASVAPNDADVFVMTKDIAASSGIADEQLIILNNIIDIDDLELKLSSYLANHP